MSIRTTDRMPLHATNNQSEEENKGNVRHEEKRSQWGSDMMGEEGT